MAYNKKIQEEMGNSFRELNRLVRVTYESFNKVLDLVVSSIKSCTEEQLPIVWGDSDYIADILEGDGDTAHRFKINAIRVPEKASTIRQLEVFATEVDGVVFDKWVDIDIFDMDTILHMVVFIEFPT